MYWYVKHEAGSVTVLNMGLLKKEAPACGLLSMLPQHFSHITAILVCSWELSSLFLKFEECLQFRRFRMESKGIIKQMFPVRKQKIVTFVDFMCKDLRSNVWDVTVSCGIWRRVGIFEIKNKETCFFWNNCVHVPNCTVSHPGRT
jgi:hypothetical protein